MKNTPIPRYMPTADLIHGKPSTVFRADPSGGWVLHSDHLAAVAKLEAEIARLTPTPPDPVSGKSTPCPVPDAPADREGSPASLAFRLLDAIDAIAELPNGFATSAFSSVKACQVWCEFAEASTAVRVARTVARTPFPGNPPSTPTREPSPDGMIPCVEMDVVLPDEECGVVIGYVAEKGADVVVRMNGGGIRHVKLSDVRPLPAQLRAERDNWERTAAQFSDGCDYYRGIVVRIGEMLGEAAKTQDDGGKVPDVLCAKVAELVESRLAKLDVLIREAKQKDERIARLCLDLDSARNDTRLADGTYAMANANIAELKGSLAAADAKLEAAKDATRKAIDGYRADNEWRAGEIASADRALIAAGLPPENRTITERIKILVDGRDHWKARATSLDRQGYEVARERDALKAKLADAEATVARRGATITELVEKGAKECARLRAELDLSRRTNLAADRGDRAGKCPARVITSFPPDDTIRFGLQFHRGSELVRFAVKLPKNPTRDEVINAVLKLEKAAENPDAPESKSAIGDAILVDNEMDASLPSATPSPASEPVAMDAEERRAWDQYAMERARYEGAEHGSKWADEMLAERRKRFPVATRPRKPSSPEPVGGLTPTGGG